MSKLHPIYVALDNHQYNRAIKLASALPESNVLGKALLAHAYAKSGQRYSSLLTLGKILGDEYVELKLELDHSLESVHDRQQQFAAGTNKQNQPSVSVHKKGKKTKKKQPPLNNHAPEPALDCEWDIMDCLDNPPALPDGWEVVPKGVEPIVDQTTLATISVTLNSLKLSLTAFQMYALTAASASSSEGVLTKTFCSGLSVLASPSKWHADSRAVVETQTLSHLQGIALQWARLAASEGSSFQSMLATAWASQTSLWQLQWLPPDERRSMILPRLAESMAQRLLEQEGGNTPSAEICLLSLRTLELQSKWPEMLDLLETIAFGEVRQSLQVVSSEFGVGLTSYQILTEKARILREAHQYPDAQRIYESILVSRPDDWSCWKGHLECSLEMGSGEPTSSLVTDTLMKQASSKYPLRGPHLMQVELQANAARANPSHEMFQKLASSIISYAGLFANRAICTYADLEPYVNVVTSSASVTPNGTTDTLVEFAKELQARNLLSGDDDVNSREVQSKLRGYICAIKLIHNLVSSSPDPSRSSWLPKWEELVHVWRFTMSMSTSAEGEATQRELKPGDELILLAVQQLLYLKPDDVVVLLKCTTLLEDAINHSSDNAYLKMAAINVYHELGATSRSWDLFQAIGLKHIQLDSCTFTILPLLVEGGLYNETIEVCNSMLRFQANTARDCGDYAGRAMEAGTLSKADEFMTFQRKKMNNSLTIIEAKGLILDTAALLASPKSKNNHNPAMVGGLGTHHGIVGGDSDMGRATRMVVEAHNPYAALSLVTWADSGIALDHTHELADNRDTTILFHSILGKKEVTSVENIAVEALRRGHIHGLLIRAALALDVAKGPKKGKVAKPTQLLLKRTKSLLQRVEEANNFIAQTATKSETVIFLRPLLSLCHVLTTINAGLPHFENDSLEAREKLATKILLEQALPQLREATETITVSSPKDVCTLLPSYVVPIVAVFRACATICDLYGWGKRKRNTKQCAGALALFAVEMKILVGCLVDALDVLPDSDSPHGLDFVMPEEEASLFEITTLAEATKLVAQARRRTRMRVEPILQEIVEDLDGFDVTDC